ncbi:MAG TPA: hypothetical protein VL068_00980, partial [Microthrixaceae bacterium]|nr:hypothetical protein [Microthrixaceae bacterium]
MGSEAIGGSGKGQTDGPASQAAPVVGPAAIDPRLPVIIGVGQFLNRVDQGASSIEPVGLMAEAVKLAEADCGRSGVLAKIELTAAVPTMTWR